MPRPARLLAALALIALSPVARAEEPPRASPVPHTAPAHRRHHHRRRAKLDETSARASRDGSGGPTGRAAAFRAGKHPAERAESVGSPNDGHLRGGAQLDIARPYLRLVPAHEPYDARWGLPVLLNMIDRAARVVHKRFPGAVLDVGDISHRGGGDLLRHHSHESGRDADLGFYALDARGKQVHARTFIKFDPSMASPTVPGAHYDLPRNWAFVQELLTDPAARVSHIFVAEWIRHELLTYARPRVSRALWDRAAVVMMQPHNSLPHDDHIHVRISCPHDGHSTCIELAKVASHGKMRVARKGHAAGTHVIKTPARALPPRPGKPPAAAAVAAQGPLVLPPPAPPSPAPDEVEPDVEPRDPADDNGGAGRIND